MTSKVAPRHGNASAHPESERRGPRAAVGSRQRRASVVQGPNRRKSCSVRSARANEAAPPRPAADVKNRAGARHDCPHEHGRPFDDVGVPAPKDAAPRSPSPVGHTGRRFDWRLPQHLRAARWSRLAQLRSAAGRLGLRFRRITTRRRSRRSRSRLHEPAHVATSTEATVKHQPKQCQPSAETRT